MSEPPPPASAIATLVAAGVMFTLLLAAVVVLSLFGQGDSTVAAQILVMFGMLGTAIIGVIAGGRISYYKKNGNGDSNRKNGGT